MKMREEMTDRVRSQKGAQVERLAFRRKTKDSDGY